MKKVQIGSLLFGSSHVYIQSMCTTKTNNVDAVVNEILACEAAGVDLMRVSILDQDDINALKEIKSRIHVPLVCDLHFDYELALKVLDEPIDKIRINPLNIGGMNEFKAIIKKAKDKDIAVRLGFNEGSCSSFATMLDVCGDYLKVSENLGFEKVVLSFKFSDVLNSIKVNEEASKRFDYPLHIGVTESGIMEIGLLKSGSALAPLLIQGIGSTIRISLSESPVEEVKAARRLLKILKIREDYPEVISCPSCGRSEVDVLEISRAVNKFVEENNINKTVALMGCAVNGPGEAKAADIGIAGSKNNIWILFKHGKVVRQIDGSVVLEEFKKELLSLKD